MAALGWPTLEDSSWEFHTVSADESCNAVVGTGKLNSEDEDSERELVMLNFDMGVMGRLDVWMAELGDEERGSEDILVTNWVKDETSKVTGELVKMSELSTVGGGKEVDEYGKEDVAAIKSLVRFFSTELNSIISHW